MTQHYRDDILEVLEDRLADYQQVIRGTMFGHPGFKINNRVFCFVFADGMTVKLPREVYEESLKIEEVEPFNPRGVKPMGTWVVITYPDAPDYIENWHWLETAMAYIITDEAAPPKKRKKASRS